MWNNVTGVISKILPVNLQALLTSEFLLPRLFTQTTRFSSSQHITEGTYTLSSHWSASSVSYNLLIWHLQRETNRDRSILANENGLQDLNLCIWIVRFQFNFIMDSCLFIVITTHYYTILAIKNGKKYCSLPCQFVRVPKHYHENSNSLPLEFLRRHNKSITQVNTTAFPIYTKGLLLRQTVVCNLPGTWSCVWM